MCSYYEQIFKKSIVFFTVTSTVYFTYNDDKQST